MSKIAFNIILILFFITPAFASISKYAKDMKSGDPDVRRKALYELAQINTKKGNDYIIKALDDKNGMIRRNATFILGTLKDKRAIAKLSQVVFYDESPEVSLFAAEALYKLGIKSGLKVLISSIENKNISIALLAIDKLEAMKEQEALVTLEKNSKTNVSAEVKNRAAKAVKVLKGEIDYDKVLKAKNIVEDIYRSFDSSLPEEIEKKIQKAIKLDPLLPDIYMILGTLHNQNSSKWSQAIEEFKKAQDLGYTDRGELFFYMGTLYLNLGKFQDAIKTLTKAAKEKNDADSYYQLGIVYSRINQTQKAIEVTEKAIKIDPTYSIAYYNLSQLYKSIGNPSKSSQYLDQYNLMTSKK
ncbi:MAG: HEAT repeat domain-containing protein [Pseudomonadota bacterium]